MRRSAPPSSSGPGHGPLKAKTGVRVPLGALTETHPEPHLIRCEVEMGFLYSMFSPFVLDNHMSVKTASLYSGYSIQYLRRLLRYAQLRGTKLGQIWFIEKAALDEYLKSATQTTDNRFGPQSNL